MTCGLPNGLMEVGSWLFWQLFSKYSTLAWSVWFLPSPYFYASSTSQAQNQESLIQEVSYLNLQASLIMTWQSMLLPPRATENKREATTNLEVVAGITLKVIHRPSIKNEHKGYAFIVRTKDTNNKGTFRWILYTPICYSVQCLYGEFSMRRRVSFVPKQ